jgi:hypothetical protein
LARAVAKIRGCGFDGHMQLHLQEVGLQASCARQDSTVVRRPTKRAPAEARRRDGRPVAVHVPMSAMNDLCGRDVNRNLFPTHRLKMARARRGAAVWPSPRRRRADRGTLSLPQGPWSHHCGEGSGTGDHSSYRLSRHGVTFVRNGEYSYYIYYIIVLWEENRNSYRITKIVGNERLFRKTQGSLGTRVAWPIPCPLSVPPRSVRTRAQLATPGAHGV